MASHVSTVAEVEEIMKKRPDLLEFTSTFAIECLIFASQRVSPILHSSPTLSEISQHASQDSASTVVSPYAVSEYEKLSYYHGITDDGEHPHLLYRTGSDTYPWIQPTGRFAYQATKSLRGVYDTPLNKVWSTVGPQVCKLVKDAVKVGFSIDTARFLTHGQDGENSLGPVVIWVAVHPGSTSPDTAHEVSQLILELLTKSGVEHVEVEWNEAVTSRSVGPRLFRVVGSDNATAHVRRHLTAALGISIATEEREVEDAQGTVGFFFHENRDKHGNPSNKVFGISNHHVLRKKVDELYEFKGAGARPQHVRVSGLRRFQRGLDEIKLEVSRRVTLADLYSRDIIKLEKEPSLDEEEAAEDAEQLDATRTNLDREKRAITVLEDFYKALTSQWSDIAKRDIGHVHYSPPISVDVEGEQHTEDWGTLELKEEKFKDRFGGNVVDLGTGISSDRLTEMMYPQIDLREGFKYPEGRQMRINGIVSRELLASPDLFDNEGKPCFMVLKQGSTTDLTVGCYAGLESFLSDENGVVSTEIAIYNFDKRSGPFSDKGDSGSLVFDGLGRMVAVLHSGKSKSGLTSTHVTYCTPAWWLVPRIKKRYPHADFNRTSW